MLFCFIISEKKGNPITEYVKENNSMCNVKHKDRGQFYKVRFQNVILEIELEIQWFFGDMQLESFWEPFRSMSLILILGQLNKSF